MFLASTVPAYAIIFFVTIILKGMGYTAAMALLLTAPPGVFAVRKSTFFSRNEAVLMVEQLGRHVLCICVDSGQDAKSRNLVGDTKPNLYLRPRHCSILEARPCTVLWPFSCERGCHECHSLRPCLCEGPLLSSTHRKP